jgi:hypothetical protein
MLANKTKPRDGWLDWKRLYLDTGVLLAIADNRADENVVRALLRAAADTYTLLVVSKDHMQDVVPKSDEHSRTRFVAAVERFPFVAVVEQAPFEIEPWTDEEVDIGLLPVGNFGELLKHPKAGPHLEALSMIQDREHSVVSASQNQVRRRTHLSKQGKRLFLQSCITLLSGWMGTDVQEILAMWEADTGAHLADEERAMILGIIAPWADWLRDGACQYKITEDDRQRLLRDFRDNFDQTSRLRSPGMHLARKLAGRLILNVDRKPLRSDPVDGMHASHFPYVDVATCDSGTYECLASEIGSIRGPRTPHLFRNSELKALVEAVRGAEVAPPRGCGPIR